jgi:sugar phosphate isomerase/epimerase
LSRVLRRERMTRVKKQERGVAVIALSTSYFTLRPKEPTGEAVVREARDLGFRALEVEYRVTDPQLAEIRRFVARGEIAVLSVHHPLPRPPELSPFEDHEDRPSLASLDREERQAAVRRASETLMRAGDLAAGAAVFHVGWVELDREVDPRELGHLVREGKRESLEYEEALARVLSSRRRRAPPHLDALLSSLDRVSSEAARRGVLVGVENRYHPEQIPHRGELETILRVLDGAPLGYWHDTGHAESLLTLGVIESRTEMLEAFRERVLGFHLHDAEGLDDHRAPGEGGLDFAALKPFVRSDTRLVLEVHPPSRPEAVARSVGILAEAGLAAPDR